MRYIPGGTEESHERKAVRNTACTVSFEHAFPGYNAAVVTMYLQAHQDQLL
jgi:hypothetical protein